MVDIRTILTLILVGVGPCIRVFGNQITAIIPYPFLRNPILLLLTNRKGNTAAVLNKGFKY